MKRFKSIKELDEYMQSRNYHYTNGIYNENGEEMGTIENPIAYDGNMILENGKYYIQDGVTYKCNRDTGIAVYHALKDLVGLYVELA